MSVLALGCSAVIALPLAGCNTISHFFHHFACCLQPAIGEELHLPTSRVSCPSACNILSLLLRSKTSLTRLRLCCPRPHQQRNQWCEQVTRAKTPFYSNYLSLPPRLRFRPSSLFIPLPTHSRDCGCPTAVRSQYFFEPSQLLALMLPVSHYLWQQRVTPFSSVHLLLASSDWRRTSIVCWSTCM